MNFAAGLVHAVFLQASTAFSSIHTVLPSFVATLTGSYFAVGLMASVQGIAHAVPQMFTAYFIERRERKKPLLLAIITLRWISWAALAFLTFRFGSSNPQLGLIVLVTLFAFFSIAGGAGTVIHADVFAKAIPAKRRGRFVGRKQLLGYGVAIGGLDRPAGAERGVEVRLPDDYGFILVLTAATLLIAFIGFAWRNRAEFVSGREEIWEFLTRKWAKELDYRPIKELWAFDGNHIAVRFQYEWHDQSWQWFRAYGNEQWEFAEGGLMRRREASINDVLIDERRAALSLAGAGAPSRGPSWIG